MYYVMKKFLKSLIIALILVVSATAFAGGKPEKVTPPSDGGSPVEQSSSIWDG